MFHPAPHGVYATRDGHVVLSMSPYAETFAHPAVAASDAVEEAEHPVAGRVKYLRFPVELSTGRAVVRRPPAAPGEHADEILKECGYGEAEIAALRASGAV